MEVVEAVGLGKLISEGEVVEADGAGAAWCIVVSEMVTDHLQ